MSVENQNTCTIVTIAPFLFNDKVQLIILRPKINHFGKYEQLQTGIGE